MEVLTENNCAFSHRGKLKVIVYDSPAFRDQPGYEANAKRKIREKQRHIAKPTNPPPPSNDGNSYTVTEMVNACYAKIWRHGSGAVGLNRHGEEPGIEEDSEMHKDLPPMHLEKDLDKLQKLRLKSRFKSRKCLDNDKVKSWIEAPDKFIEILTKLRQKNGNETNETESGGKSCAPKGDGLGTISAMNDQSTRTNQVVHFPQHVLLCAALQEGDWNEIHKIVKNNSIDLDALTQGTRYHYLHKTILNDQLDCARALIQNGIDVNALDSEGASPLALAFRFMNFPMVALLVHSGADVGKYTDLRIREMNKVNELSTSVSKVFEMDV